MTRYRIYTEDKNRPYISKLLLQQVPGFTMFPALGYWEETRENSLVIEILDDNLTLETVQELAKLIKKYNNQEAVLVTVETVAGGIV
jgi:hypothetical protein